MIKADLTGIKNFIDEQDLFHDETQKIIDDLCDGKIEHYGSGWLRLPKAYGEDVSSGIKNAANRIANDSEALVVIGIGGSYLGARAALDFIKTPNYNMLNKKTPDIYFVGNNLSGEHLEQVIALLGGRDFSINYISKSGSTIATARSWRSCRSRPPKPMPASPP